MHLKPGAEEAAIAPLTEQPALRVLAINTVEELRGHEDALNGLAKSAAETNVFLEPWMLLPALEAFGRRKRIVFLLFFEESPEGSMLCGFIPLQRRAWFHGLPFPMFTLWNYPHSFLATPLLRKGYAGEVINAFFAWIRNRRRGAVLLELPRISCLGDLHISLERVLQQDKLVTADSRYERALFRPRESAKLYIEEALSKKRRKEFKRLERQLSEIGTLAVERMDGGADSYTWIEEFLQLEVAGWKGRQGTAFAAREEDRTFFRKIAGEAARQGRLEMLALRLDGRAIAMKCNLLAKNGGFAFKIAYDEKFHQYSPGVLLELAQIRWLHDDTTRQWMDSCADPGHFMINRLWLDRRPLRTLVLSTGHPFGNAAVRIVRFLKFIYRFRYRRSTEDGKRDYKPILPVSSQ